MDFKKYTETFLDSLKGSILLFVYCTVLTGLTWVLMFIASFIPIIGQGPESLYNFKEITLFGVGTMCGIMSIFFLISVFKIEFIRDDGEVSIKTVDDNESLS